MLCMNFLISIVMMFGVLLVDARNIFISVNHRQRCGMLELSGLIDLISYWGYVRLFVHDLVQFLLNREGVTRDLFSMMLHVVSVLPLIWSLENSNQCIQNILESYPVVKTFCCTGPTYRYFLKPSKLFIFLIYY